MSSASDPAVSVIVPTLDRPRLLDEALRSVAGQRPTGGLEVVVVNDGGASVDAVVAAWRPELTVELGELGERSGPAAARNAGIERSSGRYLAFLDDDDLWAPDHLVRGCGPLESGAADLVYLGAVVADSRLAGVPSDGSGFRLKAYPYDRRFLHVANYLHTSSVIVRNFANTGTRFDERLEVCEDWDLWLALTAGLGFRAAFVDSVTSVYHQVPAVSGLVAGAQLESPSKFDVARDYINAKWPSSDPLVSDYRGWMAELERHRSNLIAGHRRMPNLLFDDILSYLYERISRRLPADSRDIGSFFR